MRPQAREGYAVNPAQSELALWAERGRDEGTQAAAHAVAEWTEWANLALRSLAKNGTPFTADDIRYAVGDPPSSGAAGALFLNALRSGLIERVDWATASRVSAHKRRLGLYRGKVPS